MAIIIDKDGWKTLCKGFGLEDEKDADKLVEEIGKKLDAYDTLKTNLDRIKLLPTIKAVLVKLKARLSKEDLKYACASLRPKIDKLIKDMDDKKKELVKSEADDKKTKKNFNALIASAGFKTFLKKQQISCELELWNLLAKKPQDAAAKKVYETYIEKGAPKEINISDQQRSDVVAAARANLWKNVDFSKVIKACKANLASASAQYVSWLIDQKKTGKKK